MIIVVGAGPAGLATAYHLQRRGLPYRILEKNDVGHTWRNQYDRLHLHTFKQVSGLPGLPMPEHYPPFPSADEHHQYLRDYAAHFNFNIETNTEVQRAVYDDHLWHLSTNHGQVSGSALVVATGIWSTPHRPTFAGESAFHGQIVHAQQYKNPKPFEGQRVLVVGVGNSGTEIAVDLSEAGIETAIAVRSGVDFVKYPNTVTAVKVAAWLFRTLPESVSEALLRKVRADFSDLGLPPAPGRHLDAFPVVGYDLPETVKAGRVDLYPGLARFTETGVVFDDGRTADFDTVILATGYRPTVDFVADSLEFDADGWPILEHWHSTKNPFLYCVGFTYPTTEGFLQAIGRMTREAVNDLHHRLKTSRPEALKACQASLTA